MPSRGREISQGHCHVQRFCVARVFGSERLSVSSSQNNRSCSRGWAACARLCPRPWGCRRGHRRLARRAFPPPTPTLGCSPASPPPVEFLSVSAHAGFFFSVGRPSPLSHVGASARLRPGPLRAPALRLGQLGPWVCAALWTCTPWPALRADGG